jgi:hypothetical protein
MAGLRDPPCADSDPRVAQVWTLQRRERNHQDHFLAACPAKGATVSVIRGAIRRVTRPRPGSLRVETDLGRRGER